MKKKERKKDRKQVVKCSQTEQNTYTRTHTDTSSMVKTTLRDWVPSVARFKNETKDATNYSLDLKGRFRGKGYFWEPKFYFDRKLMTAETKGKKYFAQ